MSHAQTPARIDSIAGAQGKAGTAFGSIHAQKKAVRGDMMKVIKGEGTSALTIFMDKSVSPTRLLKGSYKRDVNYDDRSIEAVTAEFYYDAKGLFRVTLSESLSGGEKYAKTHDIDVSRLNELQDSDFKFTENIRRWIAQLDEQILKLSGKAYHKKPKS
jgi:hypothetical protein